MSRTTISAKVRSRPPASTWRHSIRRGRYVAASIVATWTMRTLSASVCDREDDAEHPAPVDVACRAAQRPRRRRAPGGRRRPGRRPPRSRSPAPRMTWRRRRCRTQGHTASRARGRQASRRRPSRRRTASTAAARRRCRSIRVRRDVGNDWPGPGRTTSATLSTLPRWPSAASARAWTSTVTGAEVKGSASTITTASTTATASITPATRSRDLGARACGARGRARSSACSTSRVASVEPGGRRGVAEHAGHGGQIGVARLGAVEHRGEPAGRLAIVNPRHGHPPARASRGAGGRRAARASDMRRRFGPSPGRPRRTSSPRRGAGGPRAAGRPGAAGARGPATSRSATRSAASATGGPLTTSVGSGSRIRSLSRSLAMFEATR